MSVPAEVFTLYREVNELGLNTREIMENLCNEESDFTVDDYRFIRKSDIDDIMTEELGSDEYMLGCFNAWFIADLLGTTTDAIEAMQKAEAFEGIGKMILSMDKLEELQQNYVSADGYGHHFASYDGNENELINDEYYYFRN